ncbi:MAG: 3-methyl-2-oxobutanoate hydroxymethyltransferase [Ardenticatenaceae bacterium]|nr:3-methyl-2-oxobutanoate hydroxymethyltransferase [Ardenticatenaceae bacterium]
MSATSSTQRKFSILKWAQHKKKRIPITVMTAYDYTSAKLVDRAEIDAILVGDSVNMVVLGHDSTMSLTMDEMLHHCRAVSRGASRPFLIGDMPFMSYNVDLRETVRNAGRFLKEGGMDAVKVEGGQRTAETIRAIVQAGIPVMGHIGLTPQTTSQLGGFRVQGRTAKKAYQLVQDALAVQEAGCFAVVVESVPAVLADYISQLLDIPTIGIGAGSSCDGQVLVFHDALGIFDDFQPKFVKHFAHIGEGITAGLSDYAAEVRQRTFPTEDHTYTMKDEAWAELLGILEKEK